MSDELLGRIELLPKGEVRCSVILLHGLGDSGHGWSFIGNELSVGDELGVRFVLPHAPHQPVTINMGAESSAWYDIRRLDAEYRKDEDADGIRASESRIRALIDHEISRGVDPSRIVLGGFSQGGAIALQTGLRYPERLAGILALSTYLPLPSTLTEEASEANRDVPIFYAHGTLDPVIPIAAAEGSKALLEENGYSIDWHTYRMQHSASQEELLDIDDWLRRVFGSGESES